MSQENVEVVRAMFRAWVAGDKDAVRDGFHPDVIVRMTDDFPEGPIVGREAAMRQWAEMRSIFDLDELETHFSGVADRVIGRFSWRQPVGRGVTFLYTLCEGQVSYIEAYWDHDKALEA